MASGFSMFALSGVAAAVWMLVGVIAVARLTPDYSHAHHVMSALGAKGSAASAIHPFINNYPIGVLFAIFGGYIYSVADTALVSLTGILFVLHGVSHLVAGIFPCDEDMASGKPSPTQSIHMLSGLVMQLTLLVATGMWAFSSSVEPPWFRWVSLASLIFSIAFLVLMVKAFSKNKYVGLYQRISVGALILWAAILSGLLYAAHL